MSLSNTVHPTEFVLCQQQGTDQSYSRVVNLTSTLDGIAVETVIGSDLGVELSRTREEIATPHGYAVKLTPFGLELRVRRFRRSPFPVDRYRF